MIHEWQRMKARFAACELLIRVSTFGRLRKSHELALPTRGGHWAPHRCTRLSPRSEALWACSRSHRTKKVVEKMAAFNSVNYRNSGPRRNRLGLETLETRIHRLTLHRKYPEDAFVHAAQRLALDEPLEPFDAERELSQRHAPLRGQAARTETFE